ncbi:hypothetical protein DACRYDRAFT_115193 [Dacryopinax primogenitus]|uniref:F-box domain-containing protein n=1 Tax=Dacryopinax primogenitus (strain DJM 731) TaxID=1858805 RepID=M5G0W6_DACPD|nr:uncharacterized protein DACRYDRAFT_115193 [Dacryopinax primogenitus]EJU03891.1 hypothetical protein DACRYDRAFT_115193 [Dacryopinax primogenitus]
MARSSISPGRAVTLESLPPEITQRCLSLCDPVDVAAFAQTSHANRDFVYSAFDQVLWRELFLALFDDPRVTDPPTAALWSRFSKLDLWQKQLCERICARQVLRGLKRKLIASVARAGGRTDDPTSIDVDSADFTGVLKGEKEFSEALRVLVHVFDTARGNVDPKTLPVGMVSSEEDWDSKNVDFVRSTLDHPLLRKLVWDHTPEEAKQASAKLHVHFGLTDWDLTTIAERGKARERVYRLANYHERNRWGPYTGDFTRTPNWEHLEAMMLVVGRNVNERVDDWRLQDGDAPLMGLHAARNYTMPSIEPKAPALEIGDWAGVTGKWYRVVCFMDYRDLWGYNYGDFLAFNPSFMEQYSEAVRVMSFNLKVDSVGVPPKDIGIRGANVQTPPAIHALTRSNHMQDSYFPSAQREDEDENEDSENEEWGKRKEERPDEDEHDRRAHEEIANVYRSAELGKLSPLSAKIIAAKATSTTTSPTSSGSHRSAFSTLFTGSPSSSTSASPESSHLSPAPARMSKRPSLSEQYPTIYFSGSVRSSDAWHPTSHVHGRVEMGEDGTVFWKLTSNYDGQDRWVSEGVQIGGMKSRMGVLGIWSDAFHEHEGPAGPFWFWKAANSDPPPRGR